MEDPASPPPPPAAVANAQLESEKVPDKHPPYAEMIVSAISTLKENNGSSKTAINKYIHATYGTLPPGHSALLTHHLKRLTNHGIIKMEKLSYKLGTTSIISTSSVEKRGRGRPPKSNKIIDSGIVGSPDNTGVPPVVNTGGGGESTPAVKRGRGRPSSGVKSKPKPITPGSVKRGRGRPPKVGGSSSKPSSGKRGRGRPKKSEDQKLNLNEKSFKSEGDDGPPVISVLGVVSEEEVVPPILLLKGRPRGRPPKVGGPPKVKKVSSGRPRGRPAKIGGPPTPVKVHVSSGRPRGRPAKIGGTGTPKPKYASTGRPRGRPAKVAKVFGVTPMPMKVSGGRPVGRPRKIGGTPKPMKGSSGRRVGRPRKIGGTPKPMKGSSGRTVGRPRKIGGTPKPMKGSSGRPVGRPRKDGGSSLSHGGSGGGTPAPATVPVGE